MLLKLVNSIKIQFYKLTLQMRKIIYTLLNYNGHFNHQT